MIIDTIPQLKKLSNTEKLLLTNELWDSLSLQEDALPVPESHKKILDERLRDHEANPEQGFAWKEVKFRILKKKMNLEIFIKPRVESDLLEAFKFYDE
ncbi:MAG: hypothetical protein B6D35_12885 [Candidatus Brocadia sp. UTAMX2]|jgi:putative addiction module component (TIGR02574 family)|nr:MAG: hypothetical protein B6D35_12885 [Candidatus Brocadia sp. UTAMX2]